MSNKLFEETELKLGDSFSRDLGADHIPLVGSPTTIGESPMSPESRGRVEGPTTGSDYVRTGGHGNLMGIHGPSTPLSMESAGVVRQAAFGTPVEVRAPQLSSFNPRIITPEGQLLEAISAWAKIEMINGFSLVKEVK